MVPAAAVEVTMHDLAGQMQQETPSIGGEGDAVPHIDPIFKRLTPGRGDISLLAWTGKVPYKNGKTSRICRQTPAWVTTGTRLWAALASGRRPSRSVAMRKSPPAREGDE
jgi:hypothetical protein